MCDTESKWTLLEQFEPLDISSKFEVQISLIMPPDGPAHISLRKFAKYLTAAERQLGMSCEEAIFRPMKEGVLIPACKFSELLTQIEFAVYNFDPSTCPKIRLFSIERLSEIRLNISPDSKHPKTALLNIEKWAQIRNSDRKKTGIQTLYPTTKISVPLRCWKKYIRTAKGTFTVKCLQ